MLRVSSGLSSLNIAWTAGSIPWMEEVEEKTDGAVTFETFTGGELVELRRRKISNERNFRDPSLVHGLGSCHRSYRLLSPPHAILGRGDQ